MMTIATQETSAVLERIVAGHRPDADSLIPILQDVQEHFGYLPEQAIDGLAELLGISANEVYGVATFYTQFRFGPKGRHTIQICQGTACHVRGSDQILQELQRLLQIEAGQTTPDGLFDLERVACLGCCALAPVVAVDGKVYAAVTPKKVQSILKQSGYKSAPRKS